MLRRDESFADVRRSETVLKPYLDIMLSINHLDQQTVSPLMKVITQVLLLRRARLASAFGRGALDDFGQHIINSSLDAIFRSLVLRQCRRLQSGPDASDYPIVSSKPKNPTDASPAASASPNRKHSKMPAPPTLVSRTSPNRRKNPKVRDASTVTIIQNN